jgi:hypothetical protein
MDARAWRLADDEHARQAPHLQHRPRAVRQMRLAFAAGTDFGEQRLQPDSG